MNLNKKDLEEIKNIFAKALYEDIHPNGDITSQATIVNDSEVDFKIIARENLLLCGADSVKMIFDLVRQELTLKNYYIKNHCKDGDFVEKNNIIISGKWVASGILMAERLVLNILQQLSAIATKTKKYQEKLVNKNIKILDSRKTIPNLRILQKYAVKVGGGYNHRFNLSDAILVKDNHIKIAGDIPAIIKNIKDKGFSTKKIEIECDNISQVKQCLEVDFIDIIMLDNMNEQQIQEAIKLINKKTKIEISGGVNLDNIIEISKYDVDYISIGDLTHSIKSVDIGLDI